jgi:imidazoleglycerol phosphate synthase glutamine amidotransferase subunit HisH
MAREVTLVDAGLGNIASVERALIQVGAAVHITGDPDEVARARMVVFPGQSAFGAATQAIVDGSMGAALRMVLERGDPFLGICLGMQLMFDGSDENAGQEGLHVLPGRCRRFPDGMVEEAEPGAIEPTQPLPSAPPSDISAAQSMHPSAAAQASFAMNVPTGTRLAPIAGSFVAERTPEGSPPRELAANQPTVVSVEGSSAAAQAMPMAAILDPEEAAEPLMRRLKVPHMGWNEVEPTGDHYYFVHSYYVEADRSEDVMWMTTYGGIRFPAAVRRDNLLGCQFHPEKSQRAGLKFLRAFLLGGWG